MTIDYEVSMKQWLDGLKLLGKFAKGKPNTWSDIVFEFDVQELKVSFNGCTTTMSVVGTGQGRAIMSGRIIKALPQVPGSTIRLQQNGDMIQINSVSYSCLWSSNDQSNITLPLNPSFIDVLRLTYLHSKDTLTHAGLSSKTDEALARKDKLIAQAVDILKPLDLTAEDLEKLLVQKIILADEI